MSVINQGPKVMTTTGPKDFRRRCMRCGEYREDGLFTLDANGKAVGRCCATPLQAAVLRTDCEDGLCTCENKEPEDGKLDEPVLADD